MRILSIGLPTILLGVLSLGCQHAAVPISTEVRASRASYEIGERIVIRGVVRNITDREVAYRATWKDLFVYPIDGKGGRLAPEGINFLQPDGTKDTFLLGLIPDGLLGEFFVHLGPRQEKVFSKEFIAKVPGKYEAVFGIQADTDMEEVHDPGSEAGVFDDRPHPIPKRPSLKRKVRNAWIGTIPEKRFVFEVKPE